MERHDGIDSCRTSSFDMDSFRASALEHFHRGDQRVYCSWNWHGLVQSRGRAFESRTICFRDYSNLYFNVVIRSHARYGLCIEQERRLHRELDGNTSLHSNWNVLRSRFTSILRSSDIIHHWTYLGNRGN